MNTFQIIFTPDLLCIAFVIYHAIKAPLGYETVEGFFYGVESVDSSSVKGSAKIRR